MKKGFFALIALFTLSVGAYAQNCSPFAPEPCGCSNCTGGYAQPDYTCGSECGDCVEYIEMCIEVPCFYGRADAVLWNLGASDRALVLRNGRETDQTAFTARDFGRQAIGSPRILLGMNLTALTGIEGQYNGFQEWQSTKTLTGNSDLFLPGALGAATDDYFMADKMVMFSKTNFHSAELNLVRRTRFPTLTWLGGFRYFNFEESFNLNSTIDRRAPWHSSDCEINTFNHLYGGQLGAKWDKLITERFGLQVVGKAGVYANNAKQRTWMMDNSNEYELRNVSAKTNKTSLSGEVNLGGYFRVTENVSIVGGYNLMWLGDIARAADQLDFAFQVPSARHVTTDTLFMHGVNVGVEWNF